MAAAAVAVPPDTFPRRVGQRNVTRPWAALGLAAALLPLALPAAADQASNVPNVDLGHGGGRFYTATTWLAPDAHVLGGLNANGALADVLRYTPEDGQDAEHIANLDVPIHSISAVRAGSSIYIFGGVVEGFDTTAIRKFDLADFSTTVVGHLPTPRRFTQAFWDGTHAFVVGGWWNVPPPQQEYPHEVVRFAPATGAVDVVVSVATHGEAARHLLAGAGLTWDGTDAFLFGGGGCPNGAADFHFCKDIVRFTPGTNAVAVMQATLPEPRRGVAALWNGNAAFVFGNESQADSILRYRPGQDAPGALEAMSATLPVARGHPNAFWNGTHGIVLTGSGSVPGGFPPEVVRYDLRPGRPEMFAAGSPPGMPVEVRLTWAPPAGNTFSDPITNYRVYRSAAGGAFAAYQTLGDVLAFTDAGVALGATYCYYVTAINVRGEGPRSDAGCVVAQ